MQGPTVTASIVYNDARRGLKWAADALGLRVKSLYQTPDGKVAFAELAWRTGIIFVSDRPSADNPWARVGIASLALVAEDLEAVHRAYERARLPVRILSAKCMFRIRPPFPKAARNLISGIRKATSGRWEHFQPKFEENAGVKAQTA